MGRNLFDSGRRRAWAPTLFLGAALVLGVVLGTHAGQAFTAAAAPAQPTPSPETVTGTLLTGDGVCNANWRVERCGDRALVPVRSDMEISAFRGSLVRIQGLPTSCPQTGRDVLWLTSIEPVADCSPPTPTPAPSPTPQPGPNLALNRPVLASTDDPAGPPPLAVDGNPGTAWQANGDVAWIYVDLGQERTFNRMRLQWGTPHAVRYGFFVLEYGEWAFKYEVDGSDGGSDEFTIPRLFGRWVLLYAVVSSSPAGGYALQEWEIYGQETANLAFGQSVIVSDAQACCPGTLAIDANFETGWASEIRPPLAPGGPTPVPGSRNPWLQLRLPAGSPVVELRMFWDNVAFPWRYRVVFYDAGSTRTLEVRSQRGGLHILSWPLPVRADAILLYVETLPAVGYVALAEMEVYGPADALSAPTRRQLGAPVEHGVTWRWLGGPAVAPSRPAPPTPRPQQESAPAPSAALTSLPAPNGAPAHDEARSPGAVSRAVPAHPPVPPPTQR